VYTDRAMACLDCGQEFMFTAGEQEFYAQRGFTEAPKRCPSCRAARKAQRNAAGGGDGYSGGRNGGSSYSTDSGYGGSGGGYGNGGGGGYGGGGYGGERRPRQMYDAVCANCGKTAQVPFQPTGARPVYCSDCVQTRRG
jgi:CxxC-x17-CxxC domain-containing protein